MTDKMPDNDNSKWVTLAEAIPLTGRSERTIRRWATDGKVAAKRGNDGQLLVDVSDVTRKPSRIRRTVADTPDIADKAPSLMAELAEWRTRAELAEKERDWLRERVEHLEALLAMQTQRLLPAPRKRPWWRFWERDEPEQGE